MTWQAITARGRTLFTALRTRCSFRRIRRVVFVTTLVSGLAIGTEAAIRAHIADPRSRLPTALYTRPVAWGGDRDIRPQALGAIDGAAQEVRVPVALGDLPDQLVGAVLAVEDQRFLAHHGIDIRRIGGAMVANVRAGGIAQGGSTITQQLSKNLFLSASRTPLRKLREAAMAIALEARYSKEQILEAYLNEIYLGQDGGRAIHGVGAAARYYFGKDAEKLSLAESALLAGMIHAPNRYAPARHPVDARKRRDLVLRLMTEQQRVRRTAADAAARSRIPTRPHPSVALDSRWFRDYVVAGLGSGLPRRGGAVYTTLDATLQRAAERAVQRGLDRLRARGAEGAVVAIDPRTGDLLAMVGGRDYDRSQFNRAVTAQRQPGSAFKPIVALAALEPQENDAPTYTLASMVADEPLRVRTAKGPWEPVNYDGSFRGAVTLREAMEQSLNVPWARIGLAIGPDRIIGAARRLGITAPLQAVPSLALGSSEVTLLELTRAYGVLAAAGQLAATRTVLGQVTTTDSALTIQDPQLTHAADPAVAYLVTSALEGVVTRGTGHALNEDGDLGEIAGKTGTSSNWRDAWFVAYSPTIVVGVWVGYDDGRSLGETGASAALPIAEQFLQEAASEESWDDFEVPEGITEGQVASGDAWSFSCGSREYFLEGTAPAYSECGGEFRVREWDGDVEAIVARHAQRARALARDLILREIEGRRRRW